MRIPNLIALYCETLLKFCLRSFILVTLIFLQEGNLWAIELQPTDTAIENAIKRGKESEEGYLNIPNKFGKGACNWGMIQTKLFNIWAKSKKLSKSLQNITKEQISQIMQNDTVLITYSLCTDRPKDRKHLIVLKQGEKIIQPKSTSVSFVSNSVLWPKSPAYNVLVQSHFDYNSFDPMAKTEVYIIPQIEERLQYEIEFALMD